MQVVVSLTTIPARLPLLQPVIDSLLRQDYAVTQIQVQIPLKYETWPDASIVIPNFLKAPRILVNRTCADYGPITKVLGARVSRRGLLLYVDDDHVYPSNMVQSHVRAHELCRRTVFCGRGSRLHYPNERQLFQKPWFDAMHTADGVQGVSVRIVDVDWEHLNSSAKAWIARDPVAFSCDDIVLSVLFWEQGLTIRLVPQTEEAIPLRHAGDTLALCNGRAGGTNDERYWAVLQNYTRLHDWLQALKPLPHDIPSVVPFTWGPPEERAIAIFAYQRPECLKRVLQSIATFSGPLYLFLDGIVHPNTAKAEGDAHAWHANQNIFLSFFPQGVVVAPAVNCGVGMMQYWALANLAARYNYIIMLEDDLVLGPTYLDSLWAMREFCVGRIGSVQAGYRREHGDPHLLRVTQAAVQHVHYWGWMTTSEAWRRVEPFYTAAVHELFYGQYYRRRNFDAIKAWFARHGLPDDGRYSQDWVRDACFRLAGMPYKLYTPCRRGVPIGREGLHSSSALFDAMGLDDSDKDVQDIPCLNFKKAKLTWDSGLLCVMPSACASQLGRPATTLCSVPCGGQVPVLIDKRMPLKDIMQKYFI